jgi:hypothetical protein
VLSYNIDADAGIVTITGPQPTAEEQATLVAQLRADPRFRPTFGWLRDRRDQLAPSTDYVSRTVRALCESPSFPGSRIALLVPPSDPAHYGMMRMAQLLSDGRELEVSIFFDVDEARAWLIESRDRELA